MDKNIFTNALSQAEIDELHSEDITIRRYKELKSRCNHRSVDVDGDRDPITEDEITGICTCNICGSKFKPIGIESFEDECDRINDFIQTLKMIITPNTDEYNFICNILASDIDKLQSVSKNIVNVVNDIVNEPPRPRVEFSFTECPYVNLPHASEILANTDND